MKWSKGGREKGIKKECKKEEWDGRCYFFFFQAEDGIRDYKVTGVQTCALPISQPHIGVVIDVVKFQILQVVCC